MTDVYTDEVQRVVSRHKQAYDSAKSRSLKSGVPKSSAVADTQNDDYGDEEGQFRRERCQNGTYKYVSSAVADTQNDDYGDEEGQFRRERCQNGTYKYVSSTRDTSI
eukprot:Tbor_TRINITY_DN5973_c0_g2::TRINITY_DN5973_c0_g2_i5::g.18985::m.18985